MLVSAVLMPCAFLDSLILVSQLSFANAISHLIVNAIMLIYCLSQVNSKFCLPLRWRSLCFMISLSCLIDIDVNLQSFLHQFHFFIHPFCISFFSVDFLLILEISRFQVGPSLRWLSVWTFRRSPRWSEWSFSATLRIFSCLHSNQTWRQENLWTLANLAYFLRAKW